MPVIKVQKIPKKQNTLTDNEKILARFCYYFPQYKYHEACKLPYKRIVTMLKIANKENIVMLYNLLRIVASPHTKNAVEVKKLFAEYKSIIEND